MTRSFWCRVVAPVFAGAAIYVAWRPNTLLVFDWLAAAGLAQVVDALRARVSAVSVLIPDLALYSLPDGLWVYALTSAMTLIWSGQTTGHRHAWQLSPALLSIFAEVGQALGLVRGTYDVNDLILCTLGALAGARPVRSSGVNA